MEVTLEQVMTIGSILVAAATTIYSFTRKTENKDIHLTHEVEELKTIVNENSARLARLEEKYHQRALDDVEVKMQLAHINEMMSSVVKPLIQLITHKGL